MKLEEHTEKEKIMWDGLNEQNNQFKKSNDSFLQFVKNKKLYQFFYLVIFLVYKK